MRLSTLYASCGIVLGLSMLPAVAVAQQGCKALTDAKELPALTSLLDSSALVANLPVPDAGAPGEVLVSVLTSAKPRALVMDSLAAAATGTTVMQRVLASLKPGVNAPPAFRVRVVLAQPVSVYVEPSVLCEPKAKGPPRKFAVTVVAGSPPPRPVTPRVKIGVNGEVLQVDLGGGTGNPNADRSFRQALEGQRYDPALLDGRPVQVWLREKRVELVR